MPKKKRTAFVDLVVDQGDQVAPYVDLQPAYTDVSSHSAAAVAEPGVWRSEAQTPSDAWSWGKAWEGKEVQMQAVHAATKWEHGAPLHLFADRSGDIDPDLPYVHKRFRCTDGRLGSYEQNQTANMSARCTVVGKQLEHSRTS